MCVCGLCVRGVWVCGLCVWVWVACVWVWVVCVGGLCVCGWVVRVWVVLVNVKVKFIIIIFQLRFNSIFPIELIFHI